MTNNLNEKRSYHVIIAAIVSALVVMLCGMITGMVYAVRVHRAGDSDSDVAGYLLEDAAYGLRNSMSALRLCNEVEPAESINRTALVFAVRAETALECNKEDWADCRCKEQFLNDMVTVLHSYSTERTIEMSDKLYEYAAKFYDCVMSDKNGKAENNDKFEYDGELIENTSDNDHKTEITDEDIENAKTLVESALNATHTEHVGSWGGHIEFNVERNGTTGYALVCGDKIIEYSFMRGEDQEGADVTSAQKLALEAAEACGYDNLTVKYSGETGKSVSVIMCKNYNGALAGDDVATAVVVGDKVVAFSAGKCDSEHRNIPTVKKTESEARRALKSETSTGTLLVRKVNGKERVCYEYRYELDDGVHYVYVCAENGKQMEVK
ncbi:MAG: hypothetical protein J1G01_05810 [Clostridiales bacterium]|nr:hypothetical protein [Clostridiales bacterium]